MEDELELPTESSRIHLNEVVKSILHTENFDLKILKGSSIGDNYIGVVYRAVASRKDHKNDLNGVNHSGKNDLSLIVKLPPQNAARREQFFARPSFVKEIWIHDELLPLFQQFQESKGIDVTKNGFHEVPKYYRTVDIEMDEALYFEDLKVAGFEMYDRHKEITIEHVRLVMKVLGKFHALSFALRDQDPEKFEAFKSMEDVFSQRKEDKVVEDYMNSLMDRAKSTLDEESDRDVRDRFTSVFQENVSQIMQKLVDGKLSEPYAVVCHGDCWNNNLLFKYDSQGKPNEIRLLDWQISRYASPACDISHYIFCCTTKALRDEHYDSLLKIYHESFSEFLTRLGSDVEQLFPFDALLSEMRKNGRFGIVMAMMLLPLLTSVSEDIPDLDALSEQITRGEALDGDVFKFEKTEDIYKTKMRDIIVDMYRLGYI